MTTNPPVEAELPETPEPRRTPGGLLAPRDAYLSPLDDQRARALMGMSLLVGAFSLLASVGITLNLGRDALLTILVPGVVVAALCTAFYFMTRAGALRWAAVGFSLTLVVAIFIPAIPYGASAAGLLGFVLPIVAALMLLGPVGGLGITILAGTATAILSYTSYLRAVETATRQQLADLATSSVVGVVMLFLIYGLTSILTSTLGGWAQRAQRRARQLEVAAQISEAAGLTSTVGTLLNLAVERVRDTFGFYHAQVFLLDQERRMARLEASTGRAGVALLARGHALPVGSRSVIGQTTYSGRSVVVNDVRSSPVHRPNELLPDTRAEMALPLIVGGAVIGALDVQSTRPNAFLPEDISTLQIIVNQLATFIEKNRLVDELQRQSSEQQMLVQDAQASLRQIEELNRRLTREGWSEYLRIHRAQGALGYTLHGEQIQPDSSWTAPMRQAYQGEHSVVIRQDQQAHIAAVPVRIRGEVIGVLEIERGGNHPWMDTELEMVETLVDRLALAIENARLYEQATLAAEREHIVNKIAQDVQEAESIDAILQAALSELSTALGASRGVVQISPKEESAPDQ